MSNEDVSFSATTRQIGHLGEIFLAASAIDSQGLVIINAKGIIIYCENNHILNFQCIIDLSLFSNFNLVKGGNKIRDDSTQTSSNETQISQDSGLVDETNDNEIRFGLDLALVNHAFDVLDNKDIMCYLNYNGTGTPFIIEFEDNYISESIEFLTFYIDIAYPYDLEEQEHELIVNYNQIEYELILKSNLFSNLLQDLQQINTKELFIFVLNYMTNDLSFMSLGPLGLLKLIYPTDKTILEKIEVNNHNQKCLSAFKFSNFWKIFKSVRLSSKCKVLRDFNGIFSIQLICQDLTNKSYLGSLITVNMLEVINELNIADLESQFQDVEVKSVKKRKLDDDNDYNVNNRKELDIPLFL